MAAANQTRSPSGKARSSHLRGVIEMLVTVAVAIGIALGVQAFLVKPYRIPSPSMWPTLERHQRILVDRLDTHPGIGDIVVFHPPVDAAAEKCADSSEGSSHAAPCDHALPEDATTTFVKRVVGLPGDRLQIRDGHVWRNGIEENAPYAQPCDGGTGASCTFPDAITVPPHEYFMMGDNRGASDDGRYWGPIHQQWIIGTAFFAYWPPSRFGPL